MFTKSIRSKFLLWLGFLLVCLLIGFGVTAYQLICTNQNHVIYEQLQRRLSAVASDLSGNARGRPPGGKPDDGPPRKPAEECDTNRLAGLSNSFSRTSGDQESKTPRFITRDGNMPPETDGNGSLRPSDTEHPDSWGKHQHGFGPHNERTTSSSTRLPQVQLSAEVLNLFDQTSTDAFYFAIWNRDGIERLRSTNAPPELSIADRVQRASGPQIRVNGDRMESFLQHAMGYRVLVGRSIAPELATRRHFALGLVMAGAIILGIGLCGSWWLSGRALRPVESISAAASRISAGNLSERIDVAETSDELGQLAGTLNSTFARLDAAFAQQKQFTADASHELRTPLSVMISETQTTLARKRTEDEYRETVEVCLDTAQQMRQLTESLLELAGFDAGQERVRRQPGDLAEAARACLELVHPLADKRGIRIRCTLAPAAVTGDPDLLDRVITNLLTNAIHYNKLKGEIEISTRTENGAAILTVVDTGSGIPPEELPRIFERFYRGDKSRSRANGRSGLGLAICKAIVEAHGGKIEVQSIPGQGSTFTVTLPA